MTVYDIAAELPRIALLQERCKALAVLELIIEPDDPLYSYTAWGKDRAALMKDGSGDEWAIVFTAAGAFIRVLDHESVMTPYTRADRSLWPGLLEGMPEVFQPHVEEPAFGDENGRFVATAVLWRLARDNRWFAGKGISFPPPRGPRDTDPDGSGMLAILLDDIVDRYVEFAGDYHETELPRIAVEHIVYNRSLTDSVVQALNPEVNITDLLEEIVAIGYPIIAR